MNDGGTTVAGEPKSTGARQVRPDPAKILVPREHGQILIEPPLETLAGAMQAEPPLSNERLTEVFGDFGALRQRARREFLESAKKWAQRIGAELPGENALELPWVLTGHQVEFYHAGVWCKVAAADILAHPADRENAPARAVAFDLLVDHDLADHLGFDVPVATDQGWKRQWVEWSQAGQQTADALSAPTPEEFATWDEELARHLQAHTDTLAHLLAALRPRLGVPVPFVPWMSRARRGVEQALGVEVHHVPTSLMCQGEAWLGFVGAWIAHAPAWTKIYNQQLGTYRARMGIQSPQHPMPDLAAAPDTYELPFWIYRTGESRLRLAVQTAGGERRLVFGDQKIALPPATREQAPNMLRQALENATGDWQVRPRALTLTMFARLFLADVFIHGIGGALYDQITDGILCELFGIRPAYGCVSAAWLLPLGKLLVESESVAELLHRRHHFVHNPQQAINPFRAMHTDVAELLRDRRDLVAALHDGPKSKDRENRMLRRQHFLRLHEVNATLHHKAPRILESIDEEIAQARRVQQDDLVLSSREYFWGLHSMESLRKLMAAIR